MCQLLTTNINYIYRQCQIYYLTVKKSENQKFQKKIEKFLIIFFSDPDEKFMQHINKFKNEFHKRFCSWNCPIWFKNMQSFLQIIVHAKAFEIFIVLCIIINTIFLAADHHDADDNLKNALSIGNSGV